MSRTHGGGRLCYDLRAPVKCAPCKASNARSHTTYNRSPRRRAADKRYLSTARGFLAAMRHRAKMRLG